MSKSCVNANASVELLVSKRDWCMVRRLEMAGLAYIPAGNGECRAPSWDLQYRFFLVEYRLFECRIK